jgi:TPR repeat protein
MSQRIEVVVRWALFLAPIASGALVPGAADAAGKCPVGMQASQNTCCDVGREYIANRNECMRVRPERRCLAGHLDDCVQAGKELENEGGMGANYAAELYRFACEEGHAPACRGLGAMYRVGKGVDKDEARGRELYEQACAQGDAPACTQVAHFMLDDPNGNAVAAQELYLQACHRGDATACAEYAASLSRNPVASANESSYLELACDGGYGRACRTLLDHERQNRIVQPERERELLERACRASDAEGCLRLGDAYHDGLIAPQSSVDAAKRYRLACEGGAVQGCMRLAELTVEGDGVRRDLRKAAELYGQVCGVGVKLACERKTWVETEERRESSRTAHAR